MILFERAFSSPILSLIVMQENNRTFGIWDAPRGDLFCKITICFCFFWVLLPALAVAEDIHKVSAEGLGTTEREAITDAFRNAIEDSIGLYVDSETKMENEELISDKILTASKGYIHKYRIVSSEQDNGMTKVKIKALVKMQDVKTSLTGLNISIMSAEDMANTHARLASKLKRSQDAEPVLLKEFDEFFSPENLMNYLTIKLLGYKILENGNFGHFCNFF